MDEKRAAAERRRAGVADRGEPGTGEGRPHTISGQVVQGYRASEPPPLPAGGPFTSPAAKGTAGGGLLPADARGGELYVTRAASPDGGSVCTLWFCVRGAGNAYSPDDPASWSEVLLGPRTPGVR
jgi:hypothetical protein